MTSWMLLSYPYLFVVRMLRSQRDSLPMAMIFISLLTVSQRSTRLGRAWEVMDSLDHGVWHCRYLRGRTKVRVFKSLVLPVLLCGCETWTLTRDLRWRRDSFGTRSLRIILGYRWSDFVSNVRLLRNTQMRFVTCNVRERQLRLYEHVARFPDADLAHQILSARESRAGRRPMGRPRASWLQQIDQHLKEMGMGQASAWGIARRRLLEYRWKVDAVTHCSGACSHT